MNNFFFPLKNRVLYYRETIFKKSKFNFSQAYLDPTKPLQDANIFIPVFQYVVCKPSVGSEINMVDHEDISYKIE